MEKKVLQFVTRYIIIYVCRYKTQIGGDDMSRAEYMRNRRKEMYSVNILLKPEEGKNLDKILKIKKITKTDWIRQKINEDIKSL